MAAEHAKTLADIEKIAETDPKAADAALRRLKLVREACEAEAHETEAPFEIEALEHLLGDLEVGVGETEVIEYLGELEAHDEDASKAKAKARVAAILAAYAAAITNRKAQDV